MNAGILIFIAFLSVNVHITDGYPDGAPEEACADMMPQHEQNKPQQGEAPYSIQLSQSSMKNSDSIEITLSGDNKQFKGFLVRVIPAGSTVPFTDGEFYNLTSDAKVVCSDGVTHTNPQPKEHIKLLWKPTASLVGNVTFVATMVFEFSTFWTNITSTPLFVNYTINDVTTTGNPTTQSTESSSQNTMTSHPFTTAQVPSKPTCNPGKGCFKANCQSSECDSVVMWKHDGVNINFEIVSKYSPGKDRWYAIGFSNNQNMKDTSIVMCKYQSDSMSVELGYAPDKYYQPLKSQDSLSETYGAVQDTIMMCQFQRLINTTDEQVFNLHSKYYLMMGTGPIVGGIPQQHEKSPLISPLKIDFMKTKDISGGKSVPVKVKVHASLMICGWILLSSIGIVVARYYKNEWPKSKPMGMKVWFLIHRSIMCLVLLVTAIGIVIIFIEKEGFVQIHAPSGKSYLNAHPFLGIVVMSLTLINPIMAFFRCGPRDKNRPIFNYSHFFVGTAAQLASAVTIFIGFNLDQSNCPKEASYVVIAYLVTFFIIEIILELHKCSKKPKRDEEKDTLMDLSTLQKGSATQNEPFTTNLLAVHIICMIGYTISLLYFVISS